MQIIINVQTPAISVKSYIFKILLQVTFNLSYGMYIYGIYSYDNFKGCHTRIVSPISNTHQIGIHITIRLDSNPIGLVG